MSSIAENQTEVDQNMEQEKQFEQIEGSILARSIDLGTNKREIERSVQIEITDEIPKKPTHVRAASTTPILVDQLHEETNMSVVIEKSQIEKS